jgi:sugar (pentulose or hexulose) kinase
LLDGAGLSNDLILGLDVGTSSVKALFISVDGEILKRVEVKIATTSTDISLAEQSAQDYLDALSQISHNNAALISRVVSIGLSGHTPSVVCVDSQGNSVRPVMTWQDNRATQEADDLLAQFGNPFDVIGTSLPWSASACPAKLLWLSRHEPESVSKTRWVLQPKDFVGLHLTGKAISDPWSSKGICNVLTREPIKHLLEFIGWDSNILPELLDGFESRGGVSDQAAHTFGLPVGIPVSVGWSDAMCGMVALNVMNEPSSFIITGTSAIVGASTTTPPKDGGSLYVIPNTCAPLAITYGPTQSSGSALSWISALLETTNDEAINMAERSHSPDLPIFLPYIYGERAPLWRTDLQGGFYGLGGATAQSDLAASVLEGISFAEKQVIETAENLNSSVNPLIKLGGHAGNDQRWESIRLKTLGRAISRYEDTDTTTRGSAILAHALITKNLAKSTEVLAFNSIKSSPSELQKNYSKNKYQEFLLAQESALQLADHKKERG